MHKFLDKIKSIESKPKIIKEFLNKKEIENFQKLYEKLPIEINNKRQKIIKKKWSETYFPDLQKLYIKKLETVINDFKMDNPKTLDGSNSLGLFQESFKPVSLHVDTGFNFDKVIYKQTLLPLSNEGETIIFKNRFYGCSTTFSIDPEELSAKGYNKRSSEHLMLYNQRPFDEKMYNKYLKHEDLNNLKGLEIEMVYKWRLGDLLIFDRTNLHCSSSNLKNKKIGFTTSTIKK
tara:strand:+ start:1090 stop:1788 length:699 start_codon:yes stop_codon:yes gene_type:complete